MKKTAVNIEALMAKREAISSQTIQNAINKLKEQKEKEQEQLVLQHLANVQQNTEDAVNQLRIARAQEKKCKAYLQAIAEAEQIFYTNADYSAYVKSIGAAGNEFWK